MPPNLALLIGIIFVWYAFRKERARKAYAPKGLIWPTLWYMVCSSRMVGIWLTIWHVPLPTGGGSATDGSMVDALFFLALTIIGFVILSRRGFNWSESLRYNHWIAALLGFMALSILWSKYPYVSFKRYIKVMGSVSMALVVLTNDQPLEAMFTLLRRCLYVHLPMSIVCIKYFRDIGVEFDYSGTSFAWKGISTSKNDLGQVAMLAVLYFAWDVYISWPKKRWRNFHVIYLLMAIGLLKGSENAISMTSLSVCIFAVLVFLRLQTLRNRVHAARRFASLVFYGTVGLVSLVLVHSIVMFSEDSLFGKIITTLGRNITLTDRTSIWHDVYAAASAHPLIGVGFGGFWIGRLANIPWDDQMSWVLGQAHDGYIDTYLQTGLIGVSLLAMVLFSTFPRLQAALYEDFDFACFRMTLFLTVLYVNATETTFLRGDHHFWFITLLVIWQLPRTTPVVQNYARMPEEATQPAESQYAGVGF